MTAAKRRPRQRVLRVMLQCNKTKGRAGASEHREFQAVGGKARSSRRYEGAGLPPRMRKPSALSTNHAGARTMIADTEYDYSTLLEPMTAREHMLRFNPNILELFPDPESALREDTARAAAIAAEYGVPPSSTGTYPRVIWDMANHYLPAYELGAAGDALRRSFAADKAEAARSGAAESQRADEAPLKRRAAAAATARDAVRRSPRP